MEDVNFGSVNFMNSDNSLNVDEMSTDTVDSFVYIPGKLAENLPKVWSTKGSSKCYDGDNNSLPTYKMDHPRRGKCIIFNHEDFSMHIGQRNRHGTDKDCESLTICFTNLGFEVEVYKDPFLIEIMGILQRASKEDYTDVDCFVCCLLTHGDKGVFCAADETYAPEKLWSKFLGDKCPTLAGKPKLFFIQACQGIMADEGVIVACDGRNSFDVGKTNVVIPNHADFLIANATPSGYCAWRDENDGSWFIQCLCEYLQSYNNEDILSILTAVAHKVAFQYQTPGANKFKQIPSFISMLTKKLYLGSKM